MADTRTQTRHDDAPATTAKTQGKQDAGTHALIEPKGDTLIGRAVAINKPADELYGYWRDFGNLASFMEYVDRIDVHDAQRSHWVVKAPGGKTVEWDAVVTEDEPGRVIGWKAENADVSNSGRVEFREAGKHGTYVIATISYDPPAGIVGKVIAKLFQREPAIQARRDLRRFKQLMETGEIAVSGRNKALAAAEKPHAE